MKVFLTGVSGFVGRVIAQHLLDNSHGVRALCRDQKSFNNYPQIETVTGDSTKPESLRGLLEGCDAVINLVGIIRERPRHNITFTRLHTDATRNILRAAKEQGVSRFLQMSANGSRIDARTSYHKTKWAAEELVRQSGLDWTIFRPSLIFGPQDQFVNMLAGMIRALPVVPVMGDGKYRIQPVSVINVAEGFVRALEKKESIGQTYHCGGPQDYSYDELLDLIAVALGKKSPPCKLHHPLLLMNPVVTLLQSIPQFPMTSDQLQMLLEGNCCDPDPWRNAFDLKLQDFASGIAEYLN